MAQEYYTPIAGASTVPVPGTVPPGLEKLLHLDQILIKQKREMMEILTGLEGQNKYQVSYLTSKV